jgi:hypothetical protein
MLVATEVAACLAGAKAAAEAMREAAMTDFMMDVVVSTKRKIVRERVVWGALVQPQDRRTTSSNTHLAAKEK